MAGTILFPCSRAGSRTRNIRYDSGPDGPEDILMGSMPERIIQAGVSHPADIREQELIGRVQAGEKERFYELIKPYERRVYTAAYAVLRNEAEAEDAAQEALLKALTHIGQFRAEARFSAELSDVGEGLEQGFLRGVLRFRLVAQHRIRRGVHPPLVGLDQLVETFFLSRLDAPDQFLLANVGGMRNPRLDDSLWHTAHQDVLWSVRPAIVPDIPGPTSSP